MFLPLSCFGTIRNNTALKLLAKVQLNMLNYNRTPEGEEAYASFIELPFNNVFESKLKPKDLDFDF